jgi:hypothetical protein
MHKEFQVAERTLEFRIAAFNFLNHAQPQFTGSDLQLTFAAPVAGTRNSNALTTGYPVYSVGFRMVQLAIKYKF